MLMQVSQAQMATVLIVAQIFLFLLIQGPSGAAM
jgi:hypothetical protein